MDVISLLFITGIIVLVAYAVAFFKYPRWAVAGLIIAKPIIDLTWRYYLIDNINLLKIYAGLFAILGVIFILYHRIKMVQLPLIPFWIVFLILNFISIFMITQDTNLIFKIDYFLRILSGFTTLVLFSTFYYFEKDKRFVLSIFIVAGIFPMLLWLIPVLVGNPIVSNDELQRIIGPYHDFWTFKIYALQTAFCCLAYLAIARKTDSNTNDLVGKIFYSLKNSKFLKSIVLHFMVIIGFVMIYKTYSKAGWIVLSVCIFVWFLLRKKIIQTVLVPIVVGGLIFINPFSEEFKLVFNNEINYFIKGTAPKTDVFRGRLDRWETGMTDFNTLPVIDRLIGTEKLIGYPENDYLRVLWDNGIIGFLVFLSLLGLTGYLLILKYAKNKDPVVLLALVVLIMYLLSSIGFYPMLYPAFQWFMWGIIGFVLSEHKSNSKN